MCILTKKNFLNFPLFFEALKEQFSALSGGIGLWDLQQPNGFWRYGTFYIPFGMGWPCWILSLLGVGVAVASVAVRKENARPLVLCLVSFVLMAYHFKSRHVLSDVQIPLFYAIAMGVDGVAALVIGKLYDRMKEKQKHEWAGIGKCARLPNTTILKLLH